MFGKYSVISLAVFIFLTVFAAVSAQEEKLEDGIYTAIFTTDSTMFKVCEANNERGTLTVNNGEMMIHVSLSSKNILNLYPGFAEDAKKDDAVLLEPTRDEVTYSDGFQDTVYGFDIPVPYLNEDFDLALVGKKGKWYDHKVSVSDPIFIGPLEKTELTDGSWFCDVTLKGGSGKASVESPAELTISDGKATAKLVWNSKNFAYMLIDDVQYDKINSDGVSTFEIPVILDTDMPVSALTVAMSEPHLIDYTLFFDSSTLSEKQ